jgi:Leucine-rich repeat (LRR) protein
MLVSLLLAKPAVISWIWLTILAERVTILCHERYWYDRGGYRIVCSSSSLNSIPLIFTTNVEKLDLDSHSITSLVKDRFISIGLTELEEICVNGSEIETIKLRAFSGLRKLALLSVCGNKLREITRSTFEKMNSLSYLILVDNFIERLEVDLLERLINLKNFYFNKDKFQAVHPGVFLWIA